MPPFGAHFVKIRIKDEDSVADQTATADRHSSFGDHLHAVGKRCASPDFDTRLEAPGLEAHHSIPEQRSRAVSDRDILIQKNNPCPVAPQRNMQTETSLTSNPTASTTNPEVGDQ
jgi:hypothetical protein